MGHLVYSVQLYHLSVLWVQLMLEVNTQLLNLVTLSVSECWMFSSVWGCVLDHLLPLFGLHEVILPAVMRQCRGHRCESHTVTEPKIEFTVNEATTVSSSSNSCFSYLLYSHTVKAAETTSSSFSLLSQSDKPSKSAAYDCATPPPSEEQPRQVSCKCPPPQPPSRTQGTFPTVYPTFTGLHAFNIFLWTVPVELQYLATHTVAFNEETNNILQMT